MKNKSQELLTYLGIYIYLFDMCMLPTFHVAGLPFKFSYLISLVWVVLFALRLNIRLGPTSLYSSSNNSLLRKSHDGYSMLLCVYVIIFVTIIGEITASVYTTLVDTSSFRNAIFFYFVLIGGMGIGYTKYDFDKDVLIIILIAYCSVNILLSALGTSAPYFIRSLYRYVGAGESKFGFLRIVGTMGNPNATLCVMNTLLLSIVVFIRRNQINISSKIKLIAILIFPILTICFINSRSEFLVTATLEAVLLYTVFQKQKDMLKSMLWVLICLVLAIILFNVVFSKLVQKYPTVAYSINRLSTIFSSDSTKATDSIEDRPFIHLEEFAARFAKSPIWGTGFSSGQQYPFIRSTETYHNDWFRIFASGGIIGGIAWIFMIIKAIKKCEIIYLLPFIVTAVSNTFIASPPAIGIYFMTAMVLIRLDENDSSKALKERIPTNG